MKKNYAIGKLLSVYLSHIFLDFDQSEQTSSKDAFGSLINLNKLPVKMHLVAIEQVHTN